MGPRKQGTQRSSKRRSIAVMESGSGTQGSTKTASIKTKTVTVTESESTVSRKQSSDGQRFKYKVDNWETSPKTDYTYAYSGSYSGSVAGERSVSPNMSRQRLRGGAPNIILSPVAAMSQLDESMARVEYRTASRMTKTQSASKTSSNSSSSSGHNSSRRSFGVRSPREMAANLSPPRSRSRQYLVVDPSLTRSGCQYSPSYRRRRSAGSPLLGQNHTQAQTVDYRETVHNVNDSMYSGQQHMDSTDAGSVSVTNLKRLEKQLEYSGEASPYKERSLTHLYGLDQVEEEDSDISDVDSSMYTSRSSHQVASSTSSSSITSSVVTTTTTVIQSFFSYFLMVLVKTWQVITYPVRSAATYLHQRLTTESTETSDTSDAWSNASSARTSGYSISTRSTRRSSAAAAAAVAAAASSSSSVSASSTATGAGHISSVTDVDTGVATSTTSSWESSEKSESVQSAFSTILGYVASSGGWLLSCLAGVARWLGEQLWILYHWFWVTGLGAYLRDAMWASGTRVYTLVASTLVADVWLLSRTGRGRGCCCCLIPLFLLLPLFLAGSRYIYEEGGQSLMGLLPLPLGNVVTDKVVYKEGPPVVLAAGAISDQEFRERVTAIILAFYKERDAEQQQVAAAADSKHEHIVQEQQNIYNIINNYKTDIELVREMVESGAERDAQQQLLAAAAADAADARHQELVLEQQNMFVTYKSEVEELVRSLVQEQLGAFTVAAAAAAAGTEDDNSGQAAHLAQLQLEQEAQIKALQEKLLAVADKAEAQMQMDYQSQIQALHDKLLVVTGKTEGLEDALLAALADMNVGNEKVRSEGAAYVQTLEQQLLAQKAEMADLKSAYDAMLLGMKDCCKNDTALAVLVAASVEQQVAAAMLAAGGGGGGVGDGGDANSDSDDDSIGAMGLGAGMDSAAFTAWLATQYASREDMDNKIAIMAAELRDQFKSKSEADMAAAVLAAESEATKAAYIAAAAAVANFSSSSSSSSSTDKTTVVGAGAAGGGGGGGSTSTTTGGDTVVIASGCGGLGKEEVDSMIRAALLKFWADRTGMVDYALESGGGSVISTRCSETYYSRTAQLSLFGIPLWYTSNSPRTVIQPEVHPGQCWAFRGDQGFLVIELAGSVKPTAFSLEHIPRSLSPSGRIDSAPKDFSVWGLELPEQSEGVWLGNYTYDADNNDNPLQHFAVRDPEVGAFHYIELKIHNNHGNQEYTCLYRFRVHGTPGP